MIIEHDFNDAADWGVQEAPDHAALMDTTADYLQERWKLNKSTAGEMGAWIDAREELASESARSGALARVVGVLIHMGGDLKVSVYGLAFAVGMNRLLKWPTMTLAAEGLGVTRAAVSKKAIQWEDLLGLKRSAHMKSEKAREKYSEAQKKNHWRKAGASAGPEKSKVCQVAPWEPNVPALGTEDAEDQEEVA
jgi:hypothetical protein